MLIFLFILILFFGSFIVAISTRPDKKHAGQITGICLTIYAVSAILILCLIILILTTASSKNRDLIKDTQTYEYLISLDEEDLFYPYIQDKMTEWNKYITMHQSAQHNLWINWYVHDYYDSFTTISIPEEG